MLVNARHSLLGDESLTPSHQPASPLPTCHDQSTASGISVAVNVKTQVNFQNIYLSFFSLPKVLGHSTRQLLSYAASRVAARPARCPQCPFAIRRHQPLEENLFGRYRAPTDKLGSPFSHSRSSPSQYSSVSVSHGHLPEFRTTARSYIQRRDCHSS